MRNVFFTFGAIVLVAVGAALYFLAFRFDGVVETRIEKAATQYLGSAVEVSGVKTDLRNGTVSVDHISVANPAGFENPYAIRLNNVQAAVDYQGLEVKRVVIDNPEFFIEEVAGETNFGQLLQALQSRPHSAPDSTAAREPVIQIRHFRINESRAAFQSHSLDRFSDVKIDAIELNDLSGTPAQLAEQIAQEVVSELSSEAATALLKAQAKKKFGDVEEKVRDKLKELMGSKEESAEDGADQ